ncbi:MAG: DUF1492 domain-containing protein [Sphaerochaetaceae bacterium]|nr:DUF1492 domain-containing protein [Sphaerochaetaceae bacterium]
MTAREYLSRAYKLDQEIKSKLDQIESLKDLATSCSSVLTGMPRNPSPSQSPMADAVCKIIDLRDELNRELAQLVEYKADTVITIHRVKNSDYRLILEKRYISYLPWETIAVELGYSESWVLKLHRNAVKAVDAVLHETEANSK